MAANLLSAIVTYLKATGSVTSLLSNTDAIVTDMSNVGTVPPFILVEGYDEHLPGDSTEDEPIDLSICIYGVTIDNVRTIMGAVKIAVDSPNINPASTRTPFSWSGGQENGVMRNHSHVSKTPQMTRGGILCYDGRISYQFWVNPNQ